MFYDSVLQLVGSTPLVKINRLNTNKNTVIYAKLEGQNPGGSVKDRIALTMIEAAEKSGELTGDKVILEPTSGNTGIGLAMVAAVKGYGITVTLSAAASRERKQTLRAYGATIIETDPAKGTDGAILKARELLEHNPDKYWVPNQYDNPHNPEAHYRGTAEEIVHDLPEITSFVAGMGTGGTLMGIGKRLKEHNPNIKIIGVEPVFGHKVQGLKNMKESIKPGVFDESKLDKKVVVQDDDAYETAR